MSTLNNSGLKRRASMYKSFEIFASLFLSVGCLVSTPSISAQLQNVSEDESGTLVMVARTESAVIVSVDSKINSSDRNSDTTSDVFDGQRKLVAVGQKGACAIDGFLGKDKKGKYFQNLDVASSLRVWEQMHLSEGPAEGINGLLEAAGEAWNLQHFLAGNLPAGRKTGDFITILTCGDIVDGKPVIVRGETYVQSDSSAGYRILPPTLDDILYVDGVVGNHRFRLLLNEPARIESTLQPQYKELLPAFLQISNDMRSDAAAMASFNISTRVGQAGVDSPRYRSIWTQSAVRALFVPFFTTVERNIGFEVGPPNNAWIVTPCARFFTTVEADPWPTCP